MKNAYQKIGALVLAMLVMFATSSLSISTHYCGEHLVSYSFTDTIKKCGIAVNTKVSKESNISKKSCCNDKQVVKQGQDQLILKKIVDFESTTLAFSDNLLYKEFQKPLYGFLNKKHSFIEYSPPKILKNRQVLFQVYRI